MCKKISFKVNNGMDSALRVLTTLRRKQFDVREFSMVQLDSNSSLFEVSIEDKQKENVDRAILQVKKLVDVYDVFELAN